MAGTTAPTRKRAKQKRIPGTEEDRIKELDDAADNYVAARNERMALTDKEVEAKEKLIEVMQKHNLSIYKGEDYSVTVNEKTKTDVKVQDVADDEEEDGDDE